MVRPSDIPRILLDAARLIREGELVVFGSGALAFWLPEAPTTRDVDLWCEPAERGEVVEAVMGELSWYHERHDAYVEVWAPETFAAPLDWRSRAKTLREEAAPGVTLWVPHPWDILFAKLERWVEGDREHAALILQSFPMRRHHAEDLDLQMPHRKGLIEPPHRVRAYEAHYENLLRLLPG